MTIILIIIVLILVIKNNNLLNENIKLKSKLNKIPNFCINCGEPIKIDKQVVNIPVDYTVQNNIKIAQQNNIEIKNDVVIDKKTEPPKYTDKEIKNSLILIIGSCLLVLSAILFLTTTWSSTPNIIKTFMLVLMLIMKNFI